MADFCERKILVRLSDFYGCNEKRDAWEAHRLREVGDWWLALHQEGDVYRPVARRSRPPSGGPC
jgi:hypothetical protein